jgi:hypothetical protein
MPDNKLREAKNTTIHWPKPQSFIRKDEVIINRLRLGHSKISHGHLMRREEPVLSQICGELLTIKYLFIHCRSYTESRNNREILENIYEALGPNEDNLKKLFYFLKICIIVFNNLL